MERWAAEGHSRTVCPRSAYQARLYSSQENSPVWISQHSLHSNFPALLSLKAQISPEQLTHSCPRPLRAVLSEAVHIQFKDMAQPTSLLSSESNQAHQLLYSRNQQRGSRPPHSPMSAPLSPPRKSGIRV